MAEFMMDRANIKLNSEMKLIIKEQIDEIIKLKAKNSEYESKLNIVKETDSESDDLLTEEDEMMEEDDFEMLKVELSKKPKINKCSKSAEVFGI